MHLSKELSVSVANGSLSPAATPSSLGTPLLPLANGVSKGVVRTAEDEYIQGVVGKIFEAYTVLASLPSLEPSAIVNKTFGRLVGVAVQIPAEDVANKVLAHPDIAKITPHLQQLCSAGEYELEKFWASRIARAETEREAKKVLADFTYYENYIDLTRLELNAIASATPKNSSPPQKIAFLGSGPLPLSSLCLLQALQESQSDPIFIQNIDWDPTAISLSTTLCQKVGIPSSSMGFSCQDVAGEATKGCPGYDLTSFDVVFLAALVGRNDVEKKEVIRNVISRMKVGALLVVRSAHSLRRLLYPVVGVSMDMIEIGFEPVVVVHPYDHIVNSVVVGKVMSVGTAEEISMA